MNPPKATIQTALNDLYFKGKSMRGVFLPGDRLRIETTSMQNLEAGDIIVFNRGEQDIVHRIIQHRGDRLVTWGDANPLADAQAVLPGQLRGRVIGFNRKGKEKRVQNGPRGLKKWRRNQRFWQIIFALSRFVDRFVPPASLAWLYRIEPGLLKLENSKEYKIVFKGRKIGTYNPSNGSYTLRKPWSCFVSQRFIDERLKGEKVSTAHPGNTEDGSK